MKSNKSKKQSNLNKEQTTDAGLSSRTESRTNHTAPLTSLPEQAPTPTPEPPPHKPARILPYVNYQLREANRALSTDEVLGMLRQWTPEAYALAEIVGKWVWITFPEPPPEHLRGQLSQFGFHWNNTRKCWQHPCGQFVPQSRDSGQDPRTKYGTHFAADQKAA